MSIWVPPERRVILPKSYRHRQRGFIRVIPLPSQGGGGERTEASLWPNGTVVADSASLADVQDAVDAASDGQRVLIPNGSATWTGGISTTKQILIRAQNYTPTDGGALSRSVVLTNSASVPLIEMTSGNTYHVGVAGIEFDRGTSDETYIAFFGSGTKPPLASDVTFEDITAADGSASVKNSVRVASLGAVFWNYIFDGSENPVHPTDNLGVDIAKANVNITSPRAWTTASTMGSADTDGAVNIYFEDGLFLNAGSLDADDNARFVVRYSTLDGTRQITHGFTSTWGGRHGEYYNNTFAVTAEHRNLAGVYFWCRAGTLVFTDNVVNNTDAPSDYGDVGLLLIGDNTSPSSYPMNRQPGGGHNGSAYVVDPIYIWNNTGEMAYEWGFQPDPGDWSTIVVEDRDIFVNNGAKPGYSKFTYPHPLRYE